MDSIEFRGIRYPTHPLTSKPSSSISSEGKRDTGEGFRKGTAGLEALEKGPVYWVEGENGEEGHWSQERVIRMAKGKNLSDVVEIAQHRKRSVEIRFLPVTQMEHEAMFQVNREITKKTEQLLKDYYAGNMSVDEVKKQFIDLAHENFQANFDYNFITGTDDSEKVAMLQTFYSEFRREVIGQAMIACNEQGKQETGEDFDGWKYYNSDFYYQCDDLIEAVSESANELSEEMGLGSFEIPDYASKERWLYQDFNTAWSNPFVSSRVSLIDFSQKPPVGFRWLFSTKNASESLSVTVTMGDTTIQQQGKVSSSLRGKEKYFSSDILKFQQGQSERAKEINQFMSNFQMNTRIPWQAKHFRPYQMNITC